MIRVLFEHLIGSPQRIDVPRSCAFVIYAITLVLGVTTGAKLRYRQGFRAVVATALPEAANSAVALYSEVIPVGTRVLVNVSLVGRQVVPW